MMGYSHRARSQSSRHGENHEVYLCEGTGLVVQAGGAGCWLDGSHLAYGESIGYPDTPNLDPLILNPSVEAFSFLMPGPFVRQTPTADSDT